MPKGRSNWRIEVEVGESQALLTATVELQVVMATALDVTLVKEDVDFTKGQVVIETSKPLANVPKFALRRRLEPQESRRSRRSMSVSKTTIITPSTPLSLSLGAMAL